MKTWVISRADPDNSNNPGNFQHFWTPRGLTRGNGQDLAAHAHRAGWADTIVIQAPTHRAAVEKAYAHWQRTKKGAA